MHTAVTQGLGVCPQNSRTYCLFVTGVIGGPAGLGSTALLTTTDFEKGSAYAEPAGVTQPVFKAPCRNRVAPEDCRLRFDAGYRGANLVFKNAGSWVMIYHGETRTFTDGSAPGAPWKSFPHTPAYAEVGLARSADGIHWNEPGTAVISGADPKPSLTDVTGLSGLYGAPEPGAIVANGSVYVFFPYLPSPGSPDANQPATIQVAKATLASIGSSGSGTWYKFDGGRWDQPGLGGRGSAVVSTAGCTRPAQPWVGYSKAVSRYVMLVICHEGWFFSSATDLEREDWAPLAQVYKPQYPEFTQNQVTDDNFMMVTPGPGATLGASGDILFARDLAWGQHNGVRSLWYRPFTLSMSNPIVPPCKPAPPGKPRTCT